MIPAETQYKTHNGELLAFIEALKTWRHYLKSFKYEVFILTDYNNLSCFIDTKSLSSRQACWAQELSCYHFEINYCLSKANTAKNVLLRYLQKSQDEKDELRAKNG